MTTRLLALAAVALASLGGSLPSAIEPSTAEPAAGATWQVRPADADGQSRATFEASLDPGARSADSIVITNLGTTPLTLDLTSADMITTPSGDATLAGDDATPLAADWVTLSAGDVVLQPSESAEVPFTIAPPANAEPGDYAVAIVASLAVPVTDEDGQQAVLDTRVGARLYLRVLGELRSDLEISSVTVDRDAAWWNSLPASATTDFVVTNRGTVRLDASAVVTLTGPFGWELGRTTEIELPQLLPGESVRLSDVADDPVVIAGVIAPFVLTADVAIEATEVRTGQEFVFTTSVSHTDVPWLAVIVLGAAFIVVVTRLVGRRRHRRTATTAPVSATPAGAATAPDA